MSITPSSFADAVRTSLIPRLVQDGEIRNETTEHNGRVMHTTYSTHTNVEVEAFDADGTTHGIILWGDFNLDIRIRGAEIVLFMNKGLRQTAQAEEFATLDALFEHVVAKTLGW